jgi:glycine oxidase
MEQASKIKSNARGTGGPKSVAVIGAGVCGLGIAWRLAEAGCKVTLFEKGKAGQEASYAAAGMLAANVECEPGEESLLDLTLESQRRWPAFAQELEAASGLDIGYRECGTIVAALTRDDLAKLRYTFDFQKSLGLELSWLSPAEAREKEPYLRPGLAGAVYSPQDHQVDNRLLSEALKIAALKADAELLEDTEVTEVLIEQGRVKGVESNRGFFECDSLVLAAGAWSQSLPGLPDKARPPVRPVKGQMIALQMDSSAPLLSHVLWAPGIYLTPRESGRLILGATVEERGFDKEMTAGGVLALLEAAWRAVPALEELPIEELWSGLRPTSRDDAPILGPGEIEGLHYATGHHRNGILLAPVTADLVAKSILSGRMVPEIEAFGMARFHRAAERAGSVSVREAS